MLNERRLIIDVGTNSVLALLADVSGSSLKVISDRRQTTRLGESLLKNRYLSGDAIDRTINAISEFTASQEYDFAAALGTEALRIAENSNEFRDILMKRLGLELTVLKGTEEAELSYLGSIYNLENLGGSIVQIDVGGGSTEITRVAEQKITNMASIPIGALKLLEILPSAGIEQYTERVSNIIENGLAGFGEPVENQLLATGGTITAAAAIAAGSRQFNPSEIHGMILRKSKIIEIARHFENSVDKKSLIPFDTERSELILPGLGIFLAVMSIMSTWELKVSTGGLRYGAALYPDKIKA